MAQFTNFNSIIGNGKSYTVPIYQRDYSWDKEDWEDLWNDIMEIPSDKSHYMGYLVLQPFETENSTYLVIDGQQRITTLSILSLAVTALLRKWSEEGIEATDNKTRFDEITKRYIGNFSTSRLTLSSKLKLNRNNDDFYQSYLISLRRPPSIGKLKPSQKLLQKAFDYFYNMLDEKFSSQKSGSELSEFLEKIVGNGLIFTVIEVQNDLDAFKVFETLNARGVKSSTADLLKNYLFSQAAKKGKLQLDQAERRWQNIADSLKTNYLTTFIRHYWNSRNDLERQSTLFKAIKRKITDADKAFGLLDSLERNVTYYSAFNEPNDELWEKDERKHLKTLKLLEVTTCYSMMLASLEFFSRNEFKILLRELAAITFRYNLSGLNPNEAERIFGKVATEIATKKFQHTKQAILQLKSIYVVDDNFEQSFSTISLSTKRNKTLVKYILVEFENHLSGTDHQYDDATSTIEHILPENPGSIWEQNFTSESQPEYIYRVGNYTLLEVGKNNKLSNELNFQKKLQEYQSSSYKMTKDHLKYEDWTISTLSQHQEQMSKWAKAIWKSAFL